MDRFAHMQVLSAWSRPAASAPPPSASTSPSPLSAGVWPNSKRTSASPCIHRTTRRLNLTDSGRAYYARCVVILADLEEAESAVSQAHQALKGRLKVALPLPSACCTWRR